MGSGCGLGLGCGLGPGCGLGLGFGLTAQDATFLFVTNEIGLGGVSENTLQRRFTDLEGWTNQYIAARADEVVLMISGIPVKIK